MADRYALRKAARRLDAGAGHARAGEARALDEIRCAAGALRRAHEVPYAPGRTDLGAAVYMSDTAARRYLQGRPDLAAMLAGAAAETASRIADWT
jgi:hypothetical protein